MPAAREGGSQRPPEMFKFVYERGRRKKSRCETGSQKNGRVRASGRRLDGAKTPKEGIGDGEKQPEVSRDSRKRETYPNGKSCRKKDSNMGRIFLRSSR